MTILQSLKKLHKKMTGQDTNSKTIGGILDSMQENYSGGTGGGSTNGSAFITTLTKHPDPNEEGTFIYTSDKTIDQILEAYQAGATCICKWPFTAGNEDEEETSFLDLPAVACADDSIVFMLAQNLFNKDSYIIATAIKDGNEIEWAVYDSLVRKDIPVLSAEENNQYKILRVDRHGDEYELAPASFIIHIGAYDNVMFTQETVQDIINAYTNSIPIEAYMESIAFADYQGTTIKYQIEKIYYADPKNDDKPYKIVFSCYDENEATKRKYITMESLDPTSNYGITLT